MDVSGVDKCDSKSHCDELPCKLQECCNMTLGRKGYHNRMQSNQILFSEFYMTFRHLVELSLEHQILLHTKFLITLDFNNKQDSSIHNMEKLHT